MHTDTSHNPVPHTVALQETVPQGTAPLPTLPQAEVPPAFGAVPPAPPIRPRDKKRVGPAVFVTCLVAAGLLGGGVASGVAALWPDAPATTASTAQAAISPVIVNNTESVNAVTAAAQKASPSVVTISVSSGSSGGTGSGIILDTEGHILTNTHVVTLDGAAADAAVEVRTNEGKVYKAAIVGTDPLSDLAVIKIDAQGLTPATLRDSGAVNVGDKAIAIGAPLGLSGTVTDGIVSAVNRTIETASSSTQSGNIGVGFSIPINQAKRVAEEIVSTGKATHGQLGLSVQDKTSG